MMPNPFPGVDVNWDDVPEDVHAKIETLITLVMTNIRALVDREDEVKLTVRANHRRVLFTVRPAATDVAFALGSGGKHANALRILLIAACRKLKFHFDMDIIGPTGEADWSSD